MELEFSQLKNFIFDDDFLSVVKACRRNHSTGIVLVSVGNKHYIRIL